MKNNEKYILHIGNSPDMVGGITTVINNIIESSMLDEYNFKAIYTTSNKNKILTFVKAFIKIIQLALQDKIEIAHLHMASNGSFFRKTVLILILKYFRISIIIHSHGGGFKRFYNLLNPIIKRYTSYTLNKADYIIVLTPSWKEFYGTFIKNKDSIKVIGNFTELPKENFNKNYNNDIVEILFLGKLCAKKGVYDLINATEILSTKNLKFNVILAGNGEIEKCQQLINKKGIQDIVSIVGWIDKEKKVDYLKRAGILTLPSYYESFGIVLIEAMSYKVPIVASTAGQMYEVMRNNIDGLLVQQGNVYDLAKSLEILILNPDLRRKYGENGYEHFKESFTDKIIIDKYKLIYKSLIRKD